MREVDCDLAGEISSIIVVVVVVVVVVIGGSILLWDDLPDAELARNAEGEAPNDGART